MGFKETPNGGNLTFDCSPSGPCIPCSRSEKNDEKYRCSETGYRIRLKCQPIGSSSKKEKSQKLEKGRSALEAEQITISTRQRSLLDDSSKSKGGSNFYITYRSCIPAVNEEKLSVLGFEGRTDGRRGKVGVGKRDSGGVKSLAEWGLEYLWKGKPRCCEGNNDGSADQQWFVYILQTKAKQFNARSCQNSN
ncbi:uncharacterized protein Fot_04048 [Forsythia ovata]|uniref:Uncharacterized protein n=1 Tax=Forsythia ovata TaxID=205694 RepID=A0ABD1XBL0_9LAMI